MLIRVVELSCRKSERKEKSERLSLQFQWNRQFAFHFDLILRIKLIDSQFHWLFLESKYFEYIVSVFTHSNKDGEWNSTTAQSNKSNSFRFLFVVHNLFFFLWTQPIFFTVLVSETFILYFNRNEWKNCHCFQF